MQKGFINEKKFAKILDNKKIYQLPRELKKLIYYLFKNVKETDFVECWQSKYLEKADIKIKINNEIKGISIKTGKYCSMHQESTESLYPFLRKIGIEEKIINNIDDFLDGKINEKRVDAITYIFYNYKKTKEIREVFNNYYIKINLILRFIFQGTEKQKYGCDAIIHGTPDNFIWATKDEILKYLINYQNNHEIYLKFSALNFKSYDRNMRNSISEKINQNEIQIKWYSLKEDLENITCNRKNKKLQ